MMNFKCFRGTPTLHTHTQGNQKVRLYDYVVSVLGKQCAREMGTGETQKASVNLMLR